MDFQNALQYNTKTGREAQHLTLFFINEVVNPAIREICPGKKPETVTIQEKTKGRKPAFYWW